MTQEKLKIDHLLEIRIKEAKASCLSSSDLIRHLWEEPLFPYSGKFPYVGRLSETGIDENSIPVLMKLINHLIEICENLPSDLKANCDSFLKYLLELCPDKIANPILIGFLNHRRKNRRLIAFDLLRKKKFNKRSVNLLLKMSNESKDVSMLEIIARHPEALISLKTAEFLLNNLTETYWRCRVIEALILNKVPDHLALVKKHPLAFIYAVGRLERKNLLSEIKPFLKKYLSDYDNLGLVIWTLGRIQAKKEIDEIEKILQKQIGTNSSNHNFRQEKYGIRFIKYKFGFKKE